LWNFVGSSSASSPKAMSCTHSTSSSWPVTAIDSRAHGLPAAETRWAISQLTSILTAVLFGVIAGTIVAVRPNAAHIASTTIALSIAVVLLRRLVVRRWLDQKLGGT